jgi:protein translocase SecG subunit
MSLLIGFLTFILVMNCLFLMLLILIQLPKKEAGAGIAFGGAATDALFGAGSGNALTKMTKYFSTLFVGLSVVLSVLNMHAAKQGTRRLEQELNKQAAAPVAAPILPGVPAAGTPAVPTVPPAANLLTPTPTTPAASTGSTAEQGQTPATETSPVPTTPAPTTPAPEAPAPAPVPPSAEAPPPAPANPPQ